MAFTRVEGSAVAVRSGLGGVARSREWRVLWPRSRRSARGHLWLGVVS